MDKTIQRCLYISNNGENKLAYANIDNINVCHLYTQPVDIHFFIYSTFVSKVYSHDTVKYHQVYDHFQLSRVACMHNVLHFIISPCVDIPNMKNSLYKLMYESLRL